MDGPFQVLFNVATVGTQTLIPHDDILTSWFIISLFMTIYVLQMSCFLYMFE